MPILRELRFKQPNGMVISQEVPTNINQSLMSGVKCRNYKVVPVSATKPLPESAISTLKYRGERIGLMIPGQAILSNSQPKNNNPNFAAFSLIAACKVCSDSFRDVYDLASVERMTTNPNSIPFLEGDAYLIISKKDLVEDSQFWEKYSASLFDNRVYAYRGSRAYCSVTDEPPPESISIREASVVSDYAAMITRDLYPYAPEPILKFFYAYQIIEILIGVNFKDRSEEIRQKLNQAAPVSITTMKDIVKEFQDSYKELPRIKALLTPTCGETILALDSFFSAIGENNPGETFGEKVYKARNVLFHDFSKAHNRTEQITPLSDGLMRHLVSKVFL